MTREMSVAVAMKEWMEEEADTVTSNEVEAFRMMVETGDANAFDKIDAWLSANIGSPYWSEVYKIYDGLFVDEQEKYRQENEEWLRNPANWNSEIYSDIFKDAYGFRPHFDPASFFGV